MNIIVPKRRGIHFEARAKHVTAGGLVLQDSGWRHNVLHDLGEELMLNLIFEPFLSSYSWMIKAVDCSYDHTGGAAEKLITDRDAGSPFATVSANDYLFLCGGYTAGGTSVTSGYYKVASKSDANNIALTADPTGATTDITGGIVVIRPMNFAIGLDNRTALAETDTIATAESYEEDGTGYYRETVDPNVGTFWTVAQDSDTGDYQATSSQVSLTASAADWQANRNAFLVAGLVDTDAHDTYLHSLAADWSNDVLVSSVAFDDPITVGNGQSLNLQFRLRLRESS